MHPLSEPAYPSSLTDPTAGWIFTTAMPIIFGIALVAVVINTYRNKRFSVISLMFLAGTTMFWIEWPADWGSYLVYNREFPMFSGWTSTWFQTYWKPVPVVFGYGIFWGISAAILLKALPAAKRRFSSLNPTLVVVLTSLAIFYLFDLTAEKTMTGLGWYSYAEPVSPAWHGAKGHMSFVWPVIPLLLFAVFESLVLDRVDANGVYPNERLFGVHKLPEGFHREERRLAAWIVSLNVALFICQPLILILGRTVLGIGVGDQSLYNP